MGIAIQRIFPQLQRLNTVIKLEENVEPAL